MHQVSFDDINQYKNQLLQPSRTAFIDECGNFGFDFDNAGVSKYYILCAIVVKDFDIDSLHHAVEQVKNSNGFSNTEMKSSSIGNNYGRRSKIISELLPIDFRVVVLVADKQEFIKDSPLATYKKSFIKFLHQRLYGLLYQTYPKLKIIEDETGGGEFQASFKKYIAEHRPKYNLFDEYDFEYTDSKDTLLVQLADMIAGSINKSYTDSQSPNYLEMLKGKILCIAEFPNKHEPYFAAINQEHIKYDKEVFVLSVRCAQGFIAKNENDEEFDKRMQIAFLRYLLFQVFNVDAARYISSTQSLSVLREYADRKVTKDFLYRRVIAKLRDAGVILASCSQGYKIPTSVEDIITYLNQTHTVVSPMLHRIGICRNLIKQQTENELDILDDAAFLRYKKYFD